MLNYSAARLSLSGPIVRLPLCGSPRDWPVWRVVFYCLRQVVRACLLSVSATNKLEFKGSKTTPAPVVSTLIPKPLIVGCDLLSDKTTLFQNTVSVPILNTKTGHIFRSNANNTLARYWLEKGAEQDFPIAQTLLAEMHMRAMGGNRNLAEAKRLLQRAMRANYTRVQLDLAQADSRTKCNTL